MKCPHPRQQIRTYSMGRELLFCAGAESFHTLRFSAVQCVGCQSFLWSGYIRIEHDNISGFFEETSAGLRPQSNHEFLPRTHQSKLSESRTKEAAVTKTRKPVQHREEDLEVINIDGRQWKG